MLSEFLESWRLVAQAIEHGDVQVHLAFWTSPLLWAAIISGASSLFSGSRDRAYGDRQQERALTADTERREQYAQQYDDWKTSERERWDQWLSTVGGSNAGGLTGTPPPAAAIPNRIPHNTAAAPQPTGSPGGYSARRATPTSTLPLQQNNQGEMLGGLLRYLMQQEGQKDGEPFFDTGGGGGGQMSFDGGIASYLNY